MKLPIYQTASKDLLLLQTNWSSAINPVISLPINQGSILKNVALIMGNNVVNHLLSRNLQGWFIVRQRGPGEVYDTQDSNPNPSLTLFLNSSLAVNIDLFVF